MPTRTPAYAAQSATSPLAPFTIDRRDPGPRDVAIDILYCGVCHSDLHTAKGEWPGVVYPCIPGHEIVGRVTRVGPEVTRFKPGALAAVGCMVDSCRTCPSCAAGLEQYCERELTFTYNSPDRHGTAPVTYGGYAKSIVVNEHFVFSVAEQPNLAAVAPLLCAGITTYSPLRHWNVQKGHKVGIVGLGGLGHMGLKLAHALGAHTVLFTTSPSKAEDARRLGADEIIISRDANQMAQHANSFDFILDTVAAPHDLDALTACLKRDAALCLLGAPSAPHPSPNITNLLFKRRCIAGSLIGGVPETQEMLDFCAKRNITADIELIPISEINTAYERMLRSDVRYRFVIDMSTL